MVSLKWWAALRHPNWGRALLGQSFALMLIVLLAEPATAQQTVPADVAQRIDAVVAAAGPLAYSQAGSDLASQEARRRAEQGLSAAVMDGLVRYPAQHAAIVGHAVRSAPALRDPVVRQATRAFPGFAPAIEQAANLTAAPAPSVEAGPAAVEAQEVAGLPEPVNDPLEGLNRGIFWFNDVLDTFIIRPVAWTYGFITPDFAKDMIANAFDNFNSPVIIANDLLQFELQDAAVASGRLVVNSTVGVLGFFDVADAWGMPAHHADFGQTLHSYGVGPGPYFVIPVLGPSTTRDALGRGVDTFLHPRTYYFDFIPTNLAISVSNGIVQREALIEPLDDLKANSLDYYAALRSAYYQNRAVELNRGTPLAVTDQVDDLFDEDFE